MTVTLVAVAPILLVATYLVLGGVDGATNRTAQRAVILVDIVYVIVVAGLIAQRIAQIVSARRSRSAGSRLHMRLIRVFTLVALVPTVAVAIFATITLNFGLEGWFSERVRQVVSNSLTAAEAYENEHRVNLEADVRLLSGFLNSQKVKFPLISPAEFRLLLENGQKQIQRGLTEAYVIDGNREIQARGERSYLFGYDPPEPADIARARSGEVVIIEDWAKNEFRALAVIPAFANRFLYVSRDVDGEILALLDQTKETIALYTDLEKERGQLLFEFALIYLGFALIVILAAIWGALWFAERLSRPVGRLASAAQRVGAGDFDVRVPDARSDDEIAMLGRVFNRMTQQVKGQRDALIAGNMETERQRRLFDSVLSGVTAGVIGLDADGRIEFVNQVAGDLLGFDWNAAEGYTLGEIVPEFQEPFQTFQTQKRRSTVGEVQVRRRTRVEKLLVRIASRSAEGRIEGYVITFDDITELVTAQRMAAWGDVARRIAHEIKNPLTPIKLSAERIRMKFGAKLGEDQPALEQYAEVIVRQTEDLRRIVDEFSNFARMRAAEFKNADIIPVLRDAVVLAETGHPDIAFDVDTESDALFFDFDDTMMSQVFNNLLKNAAEAIESRRQKRPDITSPGQIKIIVREAADGLTISVQDNGIGLPEERANLFEPYVTHRESGTGLGLSIVKKIVEEHMGQLELMDAPPFDESGHVGAEARVTFTRLDRSTTGQGDTEHKQVA